MNKKTFTLVLQQRVSIAPQVEHFTFKREDQQPLQFIPGQFITLLLPHHDKTLRRSYSLATAGKWSPPEGEQPSQTEVEQIEFAASYVPGGVASELLFHLQPGEVVEGSGPFGRLILSPEPHARIFLVATGTGVTPYRAMLPEIAWRLAQNPQLEIFLLFGTQKKESSLYFDEFLAFAQQHPRFHFRACLSREPTTNTERCEYTGYVQSQFADLNLSPEQDMVYLCGNPNMIDQAFAQLQEQGFPSARIRREKYISAGV